MKIYKFKIQNMEIVLSKPSIKAFEDFYKTMFMNVFMGNKQREIIKKELQVLIDTKKYEIIEGDKDG